MAKRRGLNVQLRETGIDETKKVLNTLGKRARDLRPVWPKVIADFVVMNKRTFQRQGASPGWSQWQAINSKWKDWKEAHGFQSGILRMTGDLRSSLINSGDPNFYKRATMRNLRVGTKVPYASIHDKGEGVPVREPIRIDTGARGRWKKIISDWVVKGDL